MQKELITVKDVVTQDIEVYRLGEGDPKVLITAGLHGGEMTGQHAAFELLNQLQDASLEGQVTIIPRANPAAFRRMRRTSPFDEQDMNRIFPGDEDGTPSQRIAHHIYNIALEHDYIVDLHCCGPQGSPYTLAQYEEYEFSEELAGLLDIPVAVQSGGAEGQLFVEAAGREEIPSVIIELPGGGRSGMIDLSAADMTVEALNRMLTLLDVLPGAADKPEPVFCEQLRRVKPPEHGLFIPAVAPGEKFSAGQTLATLNDEEISVGFSGFAIIVRPASYVFGNMTSLVLAPETE